MNNSVSIESTGKMHAPDTSIRPLDVYVRLADGYFGESPDLAYQQNFR
jgi:hypothetical protein